MNNEKIKLVKICFYGEDILYVDIEKITDWLKTGSQVVKHVSRSFFQPKTISAINDQTISKVIQE